MEEKSYRVKAILNDRKITNYLASKGLFPIRESSGKKLYRCPVHEGDNDPSFTVFTEAEYENYYCFGCHSGGTILNLFAEMEGISHVASFKALIRGVDIDEKEVFEDNLHRLDSDEATGGYVKETEAQQIDDIIFNMGAEFYSHLKNNVNFDEKEVEFFEIVFKEIDKMVRRRDLSSLKEIYYFLMDEGIPYRAECYFNKKDEEEIDKGRGHEIWSSI